MNFLTQFRSWWQGVPIANKILLLLQWTLGIGFGDWLIDYPERVIKQFQMERLFLTFLAQGSLIGLICQSSTFVELVKVEKRLGTVLFLYEIIIKNFIAQTLYILVSLICLFIGVVPNPSFGLWNITLYFLTMRQFSHPDEECQLLFTQIQFKLRSYSVFIAILLIMLQPPGLDVLCYIALATLEYKVTGNMFRLKKSIIEAIEKSRCCNSYSSRQDFIIADLAEDMVFKNTQPIQFQQFNRVNTSIAADDCQLIQKQLNYQEFSRMKIIKTYRLSQCHLIHEFFFYKFYNQMLLYPSVEKITLNSSSSEQEINECLELIHKSIQNKYNVCVLVKKPAPIDEMVAMAVEKKRQRDIQKSLQTAIQIEGDEREKISMYMAQTKNETNPTQVLKLIIECVEIVKNSQYIRDTALKIRIHIDLSNIYELLQYRDLGYQNHLECVQMIELADKDVKQTFIKERLQLITYQEKYLLQQAQLQPDNALQLFNDALCLSEKEQEMFSSVIQIKIQIAQIHKNLGDNNTALRNWQEALCLVDKNFNQDLENSRKCLLYNIGQAMFELNERVQARQYWEQAILIFTKQIKQGSIDKQDKILYAQLNNHVGALYYQEKNIEASIDFLQDGLRIFNEIHEPNSMKVADKQHNLGEAYRNLKYYDQAIEMFKKALDTKKLQLQPPNKSLGNTLKALGLIYQDKERYQNSISLLLEASQNYVAMADSQELSALRSLVFHSIGECYKSLRQLDDCAKYFKLAFDLRVTQLGFKHKLTLQSANQFGTAIFQLHQYQEALDIFMEIQEANKEIFGQEHEITGQLYNNLAKILKLLGRYSDALAYIELAIIILQKNGRTEEQIQNSIILQNELKQLISS